MLSGRGSQLERGAGGIKLLNLAHKLRKDQAAHSWQWPQFWPFSWSCSCSCHCGIGPDRLQVRGHFARQQFDKTRAGQRDGVALARRGRCCRIARFRSPPRQRRWRRRRRTPPSIGSLWQPKQEFEVGSAGAAEGRIDAAFAPGRDDRLRRLGPAGSSTVVNFALNSCVRAQ